MRLLQTAFVVTTALSGVKAASSLTDSTQAQLSTPTPAPWSSTITIGRNDGGGKRRLRVAEPADQDDHPTASMVETPGPSNDSSASRAPASDDEERGITKLRSSVTKLLKSKKITTPITNLLTGNKHQKSQAKLRALLLRSLPPEQASKLIFLKMPKNVPAKLPPTLPTGCKGYNFKIPGVSNAIIRLRMEVWFYYRIPPTYAFKQLGLVGKGSGKVLHAQANYKYFKSYFNAWYEAQKHLSF
ncbi:hypothetical protein PHYPSEUDO_007604 [Phytophthora pseudosyringae]|uniref:RxLR effector protein n=1 Tax=Phytophthora pseudosyringae TaxID=221518 RepID=A0A8T1VG71_9STRA|nr:hypothetical protein PHYPSEUDO_007604 [Phytophthora pseudosyringae]